MLYARRLFRDENATGPALEFPIPCSPGFTLIEMAIVMAIMGLVMLTLLPALNAVRSANQLALTQSNLKNLMVATAAYVQANGCLPCPANPATIGASFGTVGYGTSTVACGACSAPEGIPPFASLGLPPSTAHDGWGHWITMRVDPALTPLPTNPANCSAIGTCSAFAPPTSKCTDTDNTNGVCAAQIGSPVGYADKALCRYNLSAAGNSIPIRVSNSGAPGGQRAAVILVSHGPGGYGSYFAQPFRIKSLNGTRLAFPSNYPACSSSGFAQCNASNTETAAAQFYDMPTTVSDSVPYDDILAYADRNALVSMLGEGACSTAW